MDGLWPRIFSAPPHPKGRWPQHPDALADMARNWDDVWGDRRQELVFIGAGMDEAALRAALDAALVAETEFKPARWDGLADPFPRWGQAAA